jgi:hypothetical protein
MDIRNTHAYHITALASEERGKNLSLLAKTYLCASAASVPVEQMFSSTGLVLNSKRSSMAPYRANIVSVIHDNYTTFSLLLVNRLIMLQLQHASNLLTYNERQSQVNY